MSNNPFRRSIANGESEGFRGLDNISEGNSQWLQHADPVHTKAQQPFKKDQHHSIDGKEDFAVKPSLVMSSPAEVDTRHHHTVQSPEVAQELAISSAVPELSQEHSNSDQPEPSGLSDSAPVPGGESRINALPKALEIARITRRAHMPSFSHVRNESLPHLRPTYVRTLSSQMPENDVPLMTPGEAHAEALRQLGKAERGPKTLKRRGSNESLSSLISYSIRRPSISARSDSGHPLDTLATVLEDAAQEGNVALVEAVMGLGANPNFRSVHRLKNRRHDALNKATAAGHVDVIDYLLKQGATFCSDETSKNDPFLPIDYKLLDVAYAGYGAVAEHLITSHRANPFVQQWPRAYNDATRTVYRRVLPAKVHQRTVLDAIAKMGNAEEDMGLLSIIMDDPAFDPAATCARIYEDVPYLGGSSRMVQTTYHYSALASFVKAGWADAVDAMLRRNPDPSAYQTTSSIKNEEGQIPSTNNQCYIYPANASTKDTWLYRPHDALRILRSLITAGFDMSTAQRTADDSAARTPLSRAILANASSGVSLLLHAHPALVKADISFRLLLQAGSEQEYKAPPLAAAIVQGSLETAQVILRSGAHPHDPAFSYPNVLLFAAGHGGTTATTMLREMIKIAPDLMGEALETAIHKVKPDAVHVLLHAPHARDARLWDMVLLCKYASRDDEVRRKYLQVIDLVHGSDTHRQIPHPASSSVIAAMQNDNYVGVEKLLGLGVITSEVLNQRAFGDGEWGEVTALEWCRVAGKNGWDSVLRSYGAV
jgi:ankyrin repeat protein